MDNEGRNSQPGAERRGPRVWVLAGQRAGDRLQLEALADALGWPWEARHLAWRKRPIGWTPLYGRRSPSLTPLTAEVRAAIRPPWPDLVLSIGWRSVPVARWIGQESGARLVHLGRPRAPLDAFDLVITTPQYHLPEAPNLLRLSAPFTRLSPERLAEAGCAWRARLEHLPRPWIAVLVGGDAPPLRLTPPAAAELGQRVDALARARGGSLLVATGPRTGRTAADALMGKIDVPAHRFIWRDGGENPYLAYLALADEIVVTADSISMAHEASLTGRPIHVFELPIRGGRLIRGLRRIDRILRARTDVAGRGYLDLIRQGWIYPPRRPELFHRKLLDSGQAVPLGSPVQPIPVPPDMVEADRAVAAIHRLFRS